MNSLKYIFLLIFTASIFQSCSDWIDVEPRTTIDSNNALNSLDRINAAVNGMYDRLQTTNLYGRDLIAIPEALADNGRATNKSGRLNPEYRNTTGAHFLIWEFAYRTINEANLIIASLPARTEIAQDVRDGIEGQALFIRGLMYLELMKAYAYMPKAIVDVQNKGGVPLVLNGVADLPQVTFPPRSSIDDCYNQIYSDLKAAAVKLEKTAASRAPAYDTKSAALSLLSRAYLYGGDYANAAKASEDAMALVGSKLLTKANYIAGFRSAVNPESIFEIPFVTNENIGVNLSLQTTYTTLVAVGNRTTTGGFGDLVPSANLLAAFQSDIDSVAGIFDQRRALYELGTMGRGTAEIECTKYLGKNGTVNLDNIVIIRASEVLLNRAEAYYNTNKEAEALTDVNTIRTRAGLPAKTGLTGQALLDEILKQRRLELAFEGHRFFDLKRLGKDLVKAPANVPFTDFRILAGIPARELGANKNLVQNFGY